MGQVISSRDFRPDPKTKEAIMMMGEPTNVSELGDLLGMVNQLGKA